MNEKMVGTVFVLVMISMVFVLSLWIDILGYETQIPRWARAGIWITGMGLLVGMVIWMVDR